ncbi:MAG: hypothetical protein WBN22_01005 [Verrucomicrobiia bacterium]
MPDYSNPPSITVIFGRSGSCKTTFAFAYLLNVQGVACRFIFDDRGQAAARLKLRPCGTPEECYADLATRWVCFNPHARYRGEQLPEAFRWFCNFAFEASRSGRGRKILLVDEIWQWSNSRRPVPPELENVIRTGRTEGLELLTATHSPREYHELIRSQATEFVAFNTVEPAQLESIEPYWPGVAAAAALPNGHFLAYNRETGGTLSGALERGWPPGRFIRNERPL